MWLVSFGINFQNSSKLLHASVFYTYLWLNCIPLYGYIMLLLHSPVGRYLDCFYFLAIMNNAPIKFYAQVFYVHMFSFLLDKYLGAELLSHMITLCSKSC